MEHPSYPITGKPLYRDSTRVCAPKTTRAVCAEEVQNLSKSCNRKKENCMLLLKARYCSKPSLYYFHYIKLQTSNVESQSPPIARVSRRLVVLHAVDIMAHIKEWGEAKSTITSEGNIPAILTRKRNIVG